MTTPSGRKRAVFGLAAVSLSGLTTLGLLVAGDLYFHARYGINRWGYRGPVVAPKRPGETRIVVLGGSAAWGYGVRWDEALPARLEKRLLEASSRPPISVVNLAYNAEGAYAYKFALADYEYLEYDIAILYGGYNDMPGGRNLYVFRHLSPVFRRTGYLPILPSALGNKVSRLALEWRGGWDTPHAGGRTIFYPRGEAAAAGVASSLERQLGPLTDPAKVPGPAPGGQCGRDWAFYCSEMQNVIEGLLRNGKRVLVATEPYISDWHVAQQKALAGMLAARFSGRRDVKYVNLGTTVNVRDPTVAWDGLHLTREGNDRIAEGLAPAILELLRP